MSKIVHITSEDESRQELLQRLKNKTTEQEWLWADDLLQQDVKNTVLGVAEHFALSLEGNESYVQGNYALLAHLLNQVAQEDFTASFLRGLGAESEGSAKNKLVALGVLYDALSAPQLACEIFKTIVIVADSAGLLPLVLPHLYKLDQTIEKWTSVPIAEQAELFRALSALNLPSSLKVKFLTKYITNIKSPQPEQLERLIGDLLVHATPAEFLKVLKLPCVSSLTGDSLELCNVINSGSAQKYSEFAKAQAGFMAARGFSSDKCFEAVRVQGLCELAQRQQEFSIQSAAAELMIPEEEFDQ